MGSSKVNVKDSTVCVSATWSNRSDNLTAISWKMATVDNNSMFQNFQNIQNSNLHCHHILTECQESIAISTNMPSFYIDSVIFEIASWIFRNYCTVFSMVKGKNCFMGIWNLQSELWRIQLIPKTCIYTTSIFLMRVPCFLFRVYDLTSHSYGLVWSFMTTSVV